MVRLWCLDLLHSRYILILVLNGNLFLHGWWRPPAVAPHDPSVTGPSASFRGLLNRTFSARDSTITTSLILFTFSRTIPR